MMIYYESSQAVTTTPEGWIPIQVRNMVTSSMLHWCDNQHSIGNYIHLNDDTVCFSQEEDATLFALRWI